MSKVFKAVGNAISSVVKGVVKAVTNVVKAVVNVVSSVINFVTQPFMGLLGGVPSIPDASQEAERQQGVLVQTQGSNISVPVAYGYRKVGGTVVFAETGSTNNRYLYVAYVFSEGLVEGLREVFIDDWQLPVTLTANLNAGQVVDVATDRYAGRVRLQWWPGAYFTNPSSSPVGNSVKSGIFAEAPSFTARMNFNGLAVLFARYEWKEIKTQADADSNPFSGNIPQVQVSVLGKRVASLLVDTTETQEYDNNIIRYSTNPAEILLDYLRNPRYGKGLKNEDIHWDSWKKSARKCNQTVTYLNTTSDITGPILTSNYVLDTGQTIMTNVKTLLMGFRAYMPYVQGKYKLRIEDAGNETDITSGVATILMTAVAQPYLKSSYVGNVCDIVGNVTYTGIDKGSKYNVVSVSYVDPDQKFSVQQVIYPETEQERQIYIDRDGGRENKLDATFPTLTNYAMAKDMARLLFNKSRRQETCSLTISSEGLELEPGDNIRIQSNVLNFGTDPWRVVSLKVNDNMTVDIACVRNPDDIYPYVRAGEEDIVLAVYVPKGSIIYYPSSDNQPLIGLVPPTRAVYPSDFAPTVTNPGSTDPNGSTGGGVGGGNPPGGTGGTTPVPPVNNPATPVPPPQPFNAVLSLKSSKAVSAGNGLYNFNVIFAQPQDGLYARSVLWWRYNPYAPWNEVKLDTLPGAGGDIPWVFTAGFGQYEYYVRAFATDGRASTSVVKGIVNFPQNVAELNPSLTGIATAAAQQVTEGWAVPPSLVESAPRYNDAINSIGIFTKLVAGAHTNPRRLRVIMNQNTNTYANTPNQLISGVRIYYKYTTDTYYSYEDFQFSSVANYAAGVQVAFDLAGDFGVPGAGFDNYNFLVRLLYSDGTAAQKQMGPVTASVQSDGLGGVNYVVAGTVGTTITTGFNVRSSLTSVDIPQNFVLQTVDQDPNRSFATPPDIIPQIVRIVSNNSLPRIEFVFSRPANSRFRGFRIRFRPVVPGTTPAFTTIDVGATVDAFSEITQVINDQGYSLNNYFDWVITALYSNNGTQTECLNSLACRAIVPLNSGLLYSNLMNNIFVFTQVTTENALNNLRSSFPALPTPVAFNWFKHMDRARSSTGFSPNTLNANATAADIYYSGTGYFLNRYFKLKFQMPNDTFDGIVVYRRIFDSNGSLATATSGYAKHWLLGGWEKVFVQRTNMVKGADGLYTLNVRGPLDYTLFDPYYEVSGFAGRTLFQSKFGSTGNFPSATATPRASNIYPYAGTGNADFRAGTTTKWAEFIFVIRDLGLDSTKGLYVKDFFADESGTNWRTDVDGFVTGNVQKNVVVNVSDYNTFTAGYRRNINESIFNPAGSANIGLNQLATGSGFSTGISTPSGATFNLLLQQPTSGDTVY